MTARWEPPPPIFPPSDAERRFIEQARVILDGIPEPLPVAARPSWRRRLWWRIVRGGRRGELRRRVAAIAVARSAVVLVDAGRVLWQRDDLQAFDVVISAILDAADVLDPAEAERLRALIRPGGTSGPAADMEVSR